jgi:transposase
MAGRKPYSDDLRELMISRFRSGASRREAGRHVGVSPATAVRWVQEMGLDGPSARQPRPRPSRSPLEAHADWLLELVAREPDLTLEQLVVRLASDRTVTSSTSALDRFFRRHEISFKKNAARRRADAAGRGSGAGDLEG